MTRPRHTSKRQLSWQAALAALSCGILWAALVNPSGAVDLSVAARPGVLPSHWIPGGPDCKWIPPFQIHAYNSDFYILRESGCVHAEKPFLYLLFGQDRAILFDTGAGGEEGATQEPDVTGAVHFAMKLWAAKAKKPVPPLVVSHLHSHGDHTYGDPQFKDAPNTTFVPPSDVSALQSAFKI